MTHSQPSKLPPGFVQTLAAIVGEAGLLTDADAIEPFLTEPRGTYRGQTEVVVRPASTAELSAVMTACANAQIAMVPQGGGTGLCGGAVPSSTGDQVVISLARMNRIRSIDPQSFTMTVEAGCILADIQRAAESEDLLFPLSLGAEGSCQIGGNLSTNAGGTQVLRFGNSRDLVLGLEVVLPDGQVLDMLRGLRKDNTGYHLAGLFCGAEGTLGIISAAVLKLFPQPREVATALVALPDLDAVIKLLSLARSATGDALSGCEFIPRIALEMVLRHIPGTRDPFPTPYPHYLLLEAQSGSEEGRLTQEVEKLLADAVDSELILDATVAQNPAQAEALWHIRESIPDAQKPEGLSIKHDVSLPIHLVPRFVRQASELVEAEVPGIRVVAFGHVGDGNVHFNLSQPLDMDRATYASHRHKLSELVHELTMSMAGSFSAEHGIGQLKRDELRRYRSDIELQVMRKIKAALDPHGLMNPGKVL
jgi:FAD/FMN-containing dehydrogenase